MIPSLDATFRFARSYSPFALAALCAVIAVAGWWSLRRETFFLAKRNQNILIVLRVLPFILLIFLLMKPVLVYHAESSVRQHVAILVDESESMTIADKVLSRIQLESAAYLLGVRQEPSKWPPPAATTALPTPERERSDQSDLRLDEAAVTKIKSTSRCSLVRRALDRDQGALLDRLRADYMLGVYGFSDQMREMPFGRGVKPTTLVSDLYDTGPSTRLGTALQRIVQDLRGQPVAGIVVISDGKNIGGIPPAGAAEVAGDARIPIYTVPVGAGGSRDIAITALIAESVVFKGDEFPISVKIASRGYSGYSAPVALECDGAQIETKQVSLTGKEQLVTFRHKRAQEGKVRAKISIRPQEGEETAENNSGETEINVIDKKIKVLMAEEIPRWDFRYLSNTLFRDSHVEVKVYLQQADRQITAGDPHYISAFPITEKELFDFDLVILGTLRPKFLRDDQMALIEKFVSKMGGGLIFLAGENISPTLWAGTPLEPLLPVRVAGEAKPWLDPDRLELHSSERRFELTDDGRRHNLATLDSEADRSEKAWRDFPPHYWAAEMGGLKPAAQVLVQSVGARDGVALPAVVLQPYGLGRVLYMGIDSTWQWRFKVGDRYFVRFWSQAVQFLTLSRLLGQNKRLQIVSDRDSYEAGQTVSLSIRALDTSFQPRKAEDIGLVIEDQTGKKSEIRGFLEPDREGVYSAVYKIPYEGHFVVSAQDGAETARLEFDAKRARLELREPEADWAGMTQIAERSGGKVVTLDHLDNLMQMLGKNRARFVDRREQALWDWWPFLAFFVVMKTLELALRKYWHLK
jgi:hypothetical protein